MMYTLLTQTPSVPEPSIIQMIKDWVLDCCLQFATVQFPIKVFGTRVTWWEILLSLFVCGTVINLITGIDGDPTEDE